MKQIYSVRPTLSLILCLALWNLEFASAQEPAATPPSAQKYKLAVVEGASTSKRVKKGRVSSQAVVMITDENDVPVPGIAITFAIPQVAGGAAFANGGLTAVVTTNAAGIASSGSFSAAAGSSFSIGATAAVPGGSVALAVPVTTAAVAATAAGISTGVLVGIIAAAGAAAAAVGIAVSKKGGGGSTGSSPLGTIGSAGTPTFGHP